MRILIRAAHRLEQRSGSTWLPPRGRYDGDGAITLARRRICEQRRCRDVGGRWTDDAVALPSDRHRGY